MTAEAPHHLTVELLRQAIDLIFLPTIHYPSLVKGLEILAYVAMLASRLQQEISRILDAEREAIEPASLPAKTLGRMQRELEKLAEEIWLVSLELRRSHVARSLRTPGVSMPKLRRLIGLYFTVAAPQDGLNDAGSSDRKPIINQNPFITAMPSALADELNRFAADAHQWYATALAQPRDVTENHQSQWAEIGEMDPTILVSRVQKSTSRVFNLIDRVQAVITDPADFPTSDKGKKKHPTPTASSLSPELERILKLPRLSYASPSTRKRTSRSRASLTPSTSISVPKGRVHFDGSDPTHRTTSMMETEGMLVAMPNESSEPITREEGEEDATAANKPPQASKPRESRRIDTTTGAQKKRHRPSLPPREGPDYTRPLPTASANVRVMSLHSFQTRDMKR